MPMRRNSNTNGGGGMSSINRSRSNTGISCGSGIYYNHDTNVFIVVV